MTTDKARKRAIRSRMIKTGESYTSARRHVQKPEPRPPRIAEPEVSEASVRRATGRGWDAWFRILDARGLDGFSHPATAAWLAAEQGLSGWWAQSVTVGFERARGLRAVHQRADGFSVGVTRTFAVSVDRLRRAFVDETERARWLDPGTLRPRATRALLSARFGFRDGTSRVGATFIRRGEATAVVAVEHDRLTSAGDAAAMRTFWRERLMALGALLA